MNMRRPRSVEPPKCFTYIKLCMYQNRGTLRKAHRDTRVGFSILEQLNPLSRRRHHLSHANHRSYLIVHARTLSLLPWRRIALISHPRDRVPRGRRATTDPGPRASRPAGIPCRRRRRAGRRCTTAPRGPRIARTGCASRSRATTSSLAGWYHARRQFEISRPYLVVLLCVFFFFQKRRSAEGR